MMTVTETSHENWHGCPCTDHLQIILLQWGSLSDTSEVQNAVAELLTGTSYRGYNYILPVLECSGVQFWAQLHLNPEIPCVWKGLRSYLMHCCTYLLFWWYNRHSSGTR